MLADTPGKTIKVLISNVFGTTNRGDAVLVDVLIDDVRSYFSGRAIDLRGIANFPDLERRAFPDVDWLIAPTTALHPNRRVRQIEKVGRLLAFSAYPLLARLPFALRLLPGSIRDAGHAIREADLVVSCAGGFLHDSNLITLTMLAQLWVAVAFRRTVLIAPQSIGPYRRPLVRRAVSYVLNRCKLICVRESVSEACVAGLLGTAAAKQPLLEGPAAAPSAATTAAPSPVLAKGAPSVVRTTDLAFYFHKCDRDEAARVLRETFGLADGAPFLAASVINWPFADQSQPAHARQRYIETFGWTLRRAAEQDNLPILLVNQVSSDLPAGRSLQQVVGERLLMDTEDRSPAVLRGILSQARAFIGSRFHSCIFAMLEGTPTIAISYLHKTDGIMADLGYPDRVHPITALDGDRLFAQLQALLGDREAVSQRLLADIDRLRHRYPPLPEVMRRHGV